MAKKSTYNAASIDVHLLDVHKIQASCQVYIGNPDSDGRLLMVKEPLQNGFDEMGLKEVKNKQIVVVLEDETVWVTDTGRGIPVEKHKTTKKSTLTTVLTTLSAGGKMRAEGKGGGYSKATAGVHGMGVSITNALSEELIVWTYRDKQWWTQTFKDGVESNAVTKCKAPKLQFVEDKLQPKCGTVIKFIVNKKYFQKDAKLEIGRLRDFLNISSYILSDIKIYLVDKKETKLYHQPDGLTAYLKQQIKKHDWQEAGKIFNYSSPIMDLALCWVNDPEEHVSSFVNGVPTTEHGTHVNGLNQAIMDVISALKLKKHEFRSEDLRTGLVAVFNCQVKNPQFTTQNKIKLSTATITEQVRAEVKQAFGKFIAGNKSLARLILDRADETAKAKADFKASKQLITSLAIKKKGKIFLPAKLLTSTTKDDAKRELFLVEGDSAKTPCGEARDSEYQEILPLKGKPLNVITASPDKIAKNEEILSILQAIGITNALKKGKQSYRYGKVIFFTDADTDGPLAANTKILTLDGKNPTIKELTKQWRQNTKPIWVWARDANNQIVPAEAINPHVAKISTKKVIIKLDDGSKLKCSTNHHWMRNTEEGFEYVKSTKLKVGDSLNSIYFKMTKADGQGVGDYLSVLGQNNHKGKNIIPAHQLVVKHCYPKQYKRWLLENKDSGNGGARHIHHINQNKLDNAPDNFEFMSGRKHGKIHIKEWATKYNGSTKHKTDLARFYASKQGLKHKNITSKNIAKYNKSEEHKQTVALQNSSQEQIKLQHLGRYARYYLGLLKKNLKINQTNWNKYLKNGLPLWENRDFSVSKIKQFICDYKLNNQDAYNVRTKRKAIYVQQSQTKFVTFCQEMLKQNMLLTELNYSSYREIVIKKTQQKGIPKWETVFPKLDIDVKQLPNYVTTYNSQEAKQKILNHKIVSIKTVKCKPTEFYCMTVPKHGNFFVADKNGNGIGTKNSHISVLLSALMYKMFKPIIKAGQLYCVNAPLFTTQIKTKRFYGVSREDLLKKIPDNLKKGKVEVLRMKGLGEANSDLLEEIAFNPKTRKLQRITMMKKTKTGDYLSVIGKDTEFKKSMLGISRG